MKTVLINGSPKKRFSASAYFLSVQRFFLRGKTVTEHLRNKGDHARVLQALSDADNVIFCLPLYVDGVPSHVLRFMQELELHCRENSQKLNVYVVSNNGFIEGCQSRPMFRVFENFCARSGLSWGGGVGIGGGVMLNVLRILFFVQLAVLLLSIAVSGLQYSNWLPVDALWSALANTLWILFFNLGVLVYTFLQGLAVSKGKPAGERFTRILLPSFLFIPIADIFFFLISLLKGGVFRGWFSRK